LPDRERELDLAKEALAWLADTQCEHGGWGDTALSLPNLSTTLLCLAAFGMAGEAAEAWRENVARSRTWVAEHAGGTSPEQLAAALEARYGKDKTFSVPILMACALGGCGLAVAVFKCGPEYLDPTYHARAAGRPSANLDGWMMGEDAVRRTFGEGARDADVALVEGVMGLFDGVGPAGDEGSSGPNTGVTPPTKKNAKKARMTMSIRARP